MYNGSRPGSGSFMTEDDGVALRELPWGQYKKKINRWFYWNSTYYHDFQNGGGDTNLFSQAQTFGGPPHLDDDYGQTAGDYGNGDGVLLYPGTDAVFPANSYGVEGPIASLRLKAWRRGIQDADYLALAAARNPAAVDEIVNQMVPKVLWEVGVHNVSIRPINTRTSAGRRTATPGKTPGLVWRRSSRALLPDPLMIVHLFNSSVVSGPERLVLPALAEDRGRFMILNLLEQRLKRLRKTDPLGDFSRSLGLRYAAIPVRGRWDRDAIRQLRGLLEADKAGARPCPRGQGLGLWR